MSKEAGPDVYFSIKEAWERTQGNGNRTSSF